MKGDNIIDSYCPVCNKSITQGDINLQHVAMQDGKKIHIIHTERAQTLLKQPVILDGLLAYHRKMRLNLVTTSYEYHKLAQEIATEHNILWQDFDEATGYLLCQIRLETRKIQPTRSTNEGNSST